MPAAPDRRTTGFFASALVVAALLCAGIPGRAAPPETPRVLMVEIDGLTPDSPELFMAIRAQLSAHPVTIARGRLNRSDFDAFPPQASASRLAGEHSADMVFWIRDGGDTCTVSFFLADPGGGRMTTRFLHLVQEAPAGHQSGRFEVIANAVSSLVDESIREINARADVAPPPSSPAPPPAAAPEPVNRQYEISAAWAGSVFSRDKLSHGVRIGLGFLPGPHLVVALAYIQHLTLEWNTPRYRLSMASRSIDALLAGRWGRRAFEFRLGLAWAIHLRSRSTASRSASIDPRPDELEAIHSLQPFMSFSFTFLKRFAIATGPGVRLSLNERQYRISRDDGSTTTVVAPYLFQFTWQLGFTIRL